MKKDLSEENTAVEANYTNIFFTFNSIRAAPSRKQAFGQSRRSALQI